MKGGSGGGSNVFHVFLMGVLVVSGYNMVGGQMPYMPAAAPQNATVSPVQVSVDFSTANTSNPEGQDNLQLKTFSGVPIATPGPPTKTCNTNDSVDVMVTLDYSGSMKGDKLEKAKNAAKALATVLESNPQNRMGVNSFNESARLYIGVTNEFPLVKGTLDNLPSGSGRTCVKCGIDMASAELAKIPLTPASASGSARKRIDILLTDGVANRPQPESSAGQAALTAAQQAYATNQVTFYTVGFGAENQFGLFGGFGGAKVNEALLTQIASQTKGKYYYSPTPDSLKYIFEDIGLIICN